jgi:hypothetical protein
MRHEIQRRLASLTLLGAAFVVTAAIGFAQSAPPTTTFDLTGIQGVQGEQGYSLAGVYTSPYLAEIGGSSVGTNVICDDFWDESFIPEEWNAYVTQLSQVPTGNDTLDNVPSAAAGDDTTLKWSGATVTNPSSSSQTLTLNQQQAYEVAALLSIDILDVSPMGVGAAIDSYALWGLFDPYGDGNSSDLGAFGTLANASLTADLSQAETILWNAAETVENEGAAALNGATATIYSFASCISSVCTTSGPPQEFIVVNMPEPSSIAILGADLLAVAALAFFLRRRMVRR